MEIWFYQVVSIDGDYANLKRTDIGTKTENGKFKITPTITKRRNLQCPKILFLSRAT